MAGQVVTILSHPRLTPDACLATHGRWMRNADTAPMVSPDSGVLNMVQCIDNAIMWRKASERKRLGR
jgi:hypothetical protein